MTRTSSTLPEATADIHQPPGGGLRTRSGLVVGISATLIVGLIATAAIFAIAKGTSDVAAQGTAGILEEASLSAAAAARNQTAQALVIAEAQAAGITRDSDLALNLSQAEAATAELVNRTDRVTDELADTETAQQISDDSAALASATRGVIGLIRDGDLAGAEAAIASEVVVSYQALVTVLADQRNQALARIALGRKDAGRLVDAARFVVVLLVPLAALLAYRVRSRREERRRELEHQLETHRAISKTKDEFITNLSHELRTPLTSIYGFSHELLGRSIEQDPALYREVVTLIASESAELSRMVEDLLTAASADQGGLVFAIEDVDPVAEVATVLDPFKATGVEIEQDMEAGLITGDRLRLRQVIRNLVSNAHRHGGMNIRLVGRVKGNQYIIEVRDDGPGVSAHLEERLFTRFIHQGDAPLLTGSVGLGLSIAHLLTTQTGGSIAHRRDKNETVFAVTYPLGLSQAA